jgi:hypothetical protein
LPNQPFLSSNYPNPFNNNTVIKYGLTKTGPVQIYIYDIWGRIVVTLIDKIQDAGYREIRWEANNLSSGLYFYRLQAENQQIRHKMLLSRWLIKSTLVNKFEFAIQLAAQGFEPRTRGL